MLLPADGCDGFDSNCTVNRDQTFYVAAPKFTTIQTCPQDANLGELLHE